MNKLTINGVDRMEEYNNVKRASGIHCFIGGAVLSFIFALPVLVCWWSLDILNGGVSNYLQLYFFGVSCQLIPMSTVYRDTVDARHKTKLFEKYCGTTTSEGCMSEIDCSITQESPSYQSA